MKAANVYLTFNGNAREAITFYKDCLGGELHVMPFSGGPEEVPEETRNKVMHAQLEAGPVVIMASDCPPGVSVTQGDNFAINLATESEAETGKLFQAFSKNGKVIMPLADTFWGAYFGMAKDQFGITWLFNYDKSKKGE